MELNIEEIPFSRRGSYFATSYFKNIGNVCIRDVRGGDESPSELFEWILKDIGHCNIRDFEFERRYELKVTETSFSLHDKETNGRIDLIYPTADTLRIKVEGIALQLKAPKIRYDSLNQMGDNQYEYISYKKETKYRLTFYGENFQVDAPWKTVGNDYITLTIDGEKEIQELVVENYSVVPLPQWKILQSFEEEKRAVEKEYQTWCEQSIYSGNEWGKAPQLANYILWSSIVRSEGLLTEESIYMSKNWMQNIWSWDNCFNAMGVGKNHPALAYKQYQIFMEHQDASGVYPDFVNNKYLSFNCCKPPIHGWAYQKLREKNSYFSEAERLSDVYESIKASTLFWLNYRIMEVGSLPFYTHGNDSGWDNASIFHEGLPVVSPDLIAYLIQQMDILSDWAVELGKEKEGKEWKERANQWTEVLLKEYHDERGFFARCARTGQPIEKRDSLILRLPLVIAYRLPQEIVTQIIMDLEEHFEGPFGLATEAKSSPLFKSDGYWLGPIWAPETYLFFDGLKRAGEEARASRIAQKFCQLATVGGMAENYNPETGAGNDDLSFTWTSSVFLLLAEYMEGANAYE